MKINMDYETLEDLTCRILIPQKYRPLFDKNRSKNIPKQKESEFINYQGNLKFSVKKENPVLFSEFINSQRKVFGNEFNYFKNLSDYDLSLLMKNIKIEKMLSKAKLKGKLGNFYSNQLQ